MVHICTCLMSGCVRVLLFYSFSSEYSVVRPKLLSCFVPFWMHIKAYFECIERTTKMKSISPFRWRRFQCALYRFKFVGSWQMPTDTCLNILSGINTQHIQRSRKVHMHGICSVLRRLVSRSPSIYPLYCERFIVCVCCERCFFSLSFADFND